MAEKKVKRPIDYESFWEHFDRVQEEMRAIAKSKGWEEKNPNIGEMIALMHSELSEALEWDRRGNPRSDHVPEYSGMEEEFADVIIRIMHLAERKNLNVAGALIAKAAFNKTRPFKHGGKKY